MASLDFDQLLSEVSPDNPAGEDLEYDPAFIALQNLTAKKSEGAIESPEKETDQVDWGAVRRGVLELMTRTRDLRLAVLLTRSLVASEGLSGLAQGLTLIHQLMDRFWDSLYPLLDHEDDDDPTMRVNVVISLCDREDMLQPISRASLVAIKGWGSYSFDDVRNAGAPPADAGDTDDEEGGAGGGDSVGQVRAAFLECPIEDLKATADALSESQSRLMAIDQLLMDKVGSSFAPDLGALANRLKEIAAVINEFLELRGEATAGPGGDQQDAGGAGVASRAVSGEIDSRESAIRMMDKISDYFRRTEPSSPVPLLMQRAKRLSSMGFLEIVKDIAPDGLQQVQNISGIDAD